MNTTQETTVSAEVRNHIQRCDQCSQHDNAADMCEQGQRLVIKALHRLLYDSDEKP